MKNLSKSNSNKEYLVKNYVMGIGLTNEKEVDILEYIVKNIPQQQKSYYIVTPNPEMIVLANRDDEFKSVLNNAKIALTDGIQLYKAAQALGVPLKERIIGTNFMEKLCEKVANRPITVGFLGGGPGIAELAAECLAAKFSGLKIVFAESEWEENVRGPVASSAPNSSAGNGVTKANFGGPPSRVTPSGSRTMPSAISPTVHDIDILFVAFGFPKQEKWMAEHVGKIPVKVMMGVGGALDQIVDPTLRPPAIVHKAGLGWLYRLVRQPSRLKRQMKLVEFLKLVQKEKAIPR